MPTRWGIAVVSAGVLVAAIGGLPGPGSRGATASAVGSEVSVAAAPVDRGPSAVSFARNASGLTFGRPATGARGSEWPDLVMVMATNHRIGYAHRSDLLPSAHPHPKALPDRLDSGHGGIVPVFEADGVTVIGQYVVSFGS